MSKPFCALRASLDTEEEATQARDIPPSEISPSSVSSTRRLPADVPAAEPAAISRLVELRPMRRTWERTLSNLGTVPEAAADEICSSTRMGASHLPLGDLHVAVHRVNETVTVSVLDLTEAGERLLSHVARVHRASLDIDDGNLEGRVLGGGKLKSLRSQEQTNRKDIRE